MPVALCLLLYALKSQAKFVKFYTFATKHEVNDLYTMNYELDPATVFSFKVDLQVLMCHIIETQPQ